MLLSSPEKDTALHANATGGSGGLDKVQRRTRFPILFLHLPPSPKAKQLSLPKNSIVTINLKVKKLQKCRQKVDFLR